MNKTASTSHLDARGLQCPLPVLKAKKALAALAPGATLEVLSTDPASVRDFEDFSRRHGHRLLESTRKPAEFRFLIQRCLPAPGPCPDRPEERL